MNSPVLKLAQNRHDASWEYRDRVRKMGARATKGFTQAAMKTMLVGSGGGGGGGTLDS